MADLLDIASSTSVEVFKIDGKRIIVRGLLGFVGHKTVFADDCTGRLEGLGLGGLKARRAAPPPSL